MKISLIKFFFVTVLCFSAVSVQAQNLKLDEIISLFNAPKYPDSLFVVLEERSFYRVDKQWLPICDRVIYAYNKGGKPSVFVNPMVCFKPSVNTHYPKRFKYELELQFQHSSRADFEKLRAQVKKQCKVIGTANATEKGAKTQTATKAYLHEATGTTLVIEDKAPVAFIYLIK